MVVAGIPERTGGSAVAVVTQESPAAAGERRHGQAPVGWWCGCCGSVCARRQSGGGDDVVGACMPGACRVVVGRLWDRARHAPVGWWLGCCGSAHSRCLSGGGDHAVGACMPDGSRVVVMMVWECACCSALAVVTQDRPRLLVNEEEDRRVEGGMGACVLFRCGSCGGVHVVYLNRALGCPAGSGSSTREALSSRELWPWRWRIDSRSAQALALHERNLATYGRRNGGVTAGQRRRHGRRPVVRLVVLDCPLSVTAHVFG